MVNCNNSRRVLVLDVGGVLLHWSPPALYRKIFNGQSEVDWFLANICTQPWNEQQDRGRSLTDGTKQLVAMYPQYEDEIIAYYSRWEEMLVGYIPAGRALLAHFRQSQIPVYFLSNWSTENWPRAVRLFPFLQDCDGYLLSGEVGYCKPEKEIYRKFLERFSLPPDQCIFVDDVEQNVVTARQLGLIGLHFSTICSSSSAIELVSQLLAQGQA